jgi:ubiquinone/menaquinone biosynthesis C-methylase UbiE
MPRHCRASFEDIARDFDHLFENVDELTRLEALSLDHILKQYGVHSVLDCACGTGIQSIGLAQKGYQVFASDISPKMLEQLQEKARAKQLTIETKRADFRTLKPWQGRKFDAVISCGNSITLVPHLKDIQRALWSMIQLTKTPGGVGIIGIHNYPKLKREGQTLLIRRTVSSGNAPELAVDLRFFGDERTQVTYMLIRFIYGRWRLKTYTKSYICLSADELRNAMLSAGFCSVKLLDLFGQREFKDDEWLLAVGET